MDEFEGGAARLSALCTCYRFLNEQEEKERHSELSPRTCKRTLTRSTGAATSVVGMAEKKPAAASSPYERTEDVRFGVAA